MKKSIFITVIGLFLLTSQVSATEPNDTYYSYQRSFYNQINLPTAWNYSTGSDEVVVAVIDTGADIEHPDLVGNVWINTAEVVGNGIDDDKNGYIDDVYGWNFVDENNDVRTSIFGSSGGDEDISHGTVIAGLIGAVGNNNRDVSGVNWKTKIMMLRAVSNDGTGSYQNIADALHYAADMGADVISMSVVGEEFSQGLKDAFRYAYDHGAVIIAAAGNERRENKGDLTETQRYPICLDSGDTENWLLGVTSVDIFDNLSSFANYGMCVDITAPGEYIYSTDHYAPDKNFNETVTGPWQGTSFSAPLVAGTAALIKSVRPDWGARAIVQTILNTTKDIDGENPQFVGRLGYGRLDAGAALQQAYQDKISEQGIDSLYFFDKTKVYQYFPNEQKKVYLFDFPETVVAMDYADLYNNDSMVIVLLTEKDGKYKIYTVTRDGFIYQSFDLPPSIAFKSVQADWLSDELSIGGAGNGYSYLYRYNIFGRKTGEIKIKGKMLKFAARNNNTIAATFLNNNTLSLNVYDWTGAKKSSWSLGQVKSLGAMSAGAVRTGGLDQIIMMIERENEIAQYIVDPESNSYTKEKMTSEDKNKNLIIKDEDADGLLDIFRFGSGGGEFGVYNADGDFIKNISLPKMGTFGA